MLSVLEVIALLFGELKIDWTLLLQNLLIRRGMVWYLYSLVHEVFRSQVWIHVDISIQWVCPQNSPQPICTSTLLTANAWYMDQTTKLFTTSPGTASKTQILASLMLLKLHTRSHGLWRYLRKESSRLQPFSNNVALLIGRSSYGDYSKTNTEYMSWGRGSLEPALLLNVQDVEACHDLCTNCHTYCGNVCAKSTREHPHLMLEVYAGLDMTMSGV